jgi:hypothetical protein
MNQQAAEDQAWFVSRILFLYLIPAIKQGSSYYRSLTNYSQSPSWMELDKWAKRMKTCWDETVANGKPSLLRAVIKCFFWRIVVILSGLVFN